MFMEYASKGVADTGLGLGIAGTALGAMAEKADDAYKPILHTIAEEEWTHAKHLKAILEDMGGEMSSEMKAAHDEAHMALYK